MGCGCKKTNVVAPEPTPEPTPTEIKRTDYPDTPEGQHAFELDKHLDEPDWYNNLDEYPLIED